MTFPRLLDERSAAAGDRQRIAEIQQVRRREMQCKESGVFVCWCGSNIAATVDVKAVAEAAEP